MRVSLAILQMVDILAKQNEWAGPSDWPFAVLSSGSTIALGFSQNLAHRSLLIRRLRPFWGLFGVCAFYFGRNSNDQRSRASRFLQTRLEGL